MKNSTESLTDEVLYEGDISSPDFSSSESTGEDCRSTGEPDYPSTGGSTGGDEHSEHSLVEENVDLNSDCEEDVICRSVDSYTTRLATHVTEESEYSDEESTDFQHQNGLPLRRKSTRFPKRYIGRLQKDLRRTSSVPLTKPELTTSIDNMQARLKQEIAQHDHGHDLHDPHDLPPPSLSTEVRIKSLLYDAACHQDIVVQASQALNIAEYFNLESSTSSAVIEGERLLLLAAERRAMCLEEVNQIKRTVPRTTYKTRESNVPPPCGATITLTDIRLPLQTDASCRLKSDGEVFHFVCVASAGYTNIQSTNVVSSQLTDDIPLSLGNITMTNVGNDFTVDIKVFVMKTPIQNTDKKSSKRTFSESTIKKNLKRLFSSSSTKTEEVQTTASGNAVFRKTNFRQIGSTKLTLNNLGRGIVQHELRTTSNPSPLRGNVRFRVGITPEYTASACGFLTFMHDVGGYPAWEKRWCIMDCNKIFFWKHPEDHQRSEEPQGHIDLNHCNEEFIKLLPSDICARRYTFQLILFRDRINTDTDSLVLSAVGDVTEVRHWICCENEENRYVWMSAINKQLSDAVAWKCPARNRHSLRRSMLSHV